MMMLVLRELNLPKTFVPTEEQRALMFEAENLLRYQALIQIEISDRGRNQEATSIETKIGSRFGGIKFQEFRKCRISLEEDRILQCSFDIFYLIFNSFF